MSLSRTLALYIVEGKASLEDVVTLLAKYHLLALLPTLQKALIQLSLGVRTQETIRIETPFELAPASIQTIQKMTGNADAPYSIVINKSILAGFKATYKGILYDGSAERIIRQLIK